MSETPDTPNEKIAWHALTPAEAADRLTVGLVGLSSEQAARRLERFGPNALERQSRESALAKFLAQFHSLLIYILIVAAVITAAIGEWLDAAVISAVVVVNAIVGFIQEWRAENALEAIRKLLMLETRVLRDGQLRRLPAQDLAPGDVVELTAGDRVPADVRLMEVEGLHCQEAALTGESAPVEKGEAPVERSSALGDRSSMAFAGTLAVRGHARGLVVATGPATQVGQVSHLVAQVRNVETPLIRQMSGLSRVLTALILSLAAVTVLTGVFVYSQPLEAIFLAAVGLSVAAVPSGLPVILTITLAVGVQRMSRRNAILRNLPAVESLGAVTVICSDKTGTITRNEMTVRQIVTPLQEHGVTGSGYAPAGEIEEAETAEAREALERLLLGAALCNDSHLNAGPEGWSLLGAPTEGALLAVAMKGGLNLEALAGSRPREAELAFTSEAKVMAVRTSGREAADDIWVKGAPERILARCALEDETRQRYEARITALAEQGLRVIALAWRAAPAASGLSEEMIAGDLTLLGFCGLSDPPRDEAITAIGRCREAGIKVKMITGDHAVTARAIATEAGLEARRVLTGPQLDELDDESFDETVLGTDVFARATPAHKLRIVETLQKAGEVVAMTGDGVNDSPALKRADVGVSMGEMGTEAAREASDMVLTDDNFASIAAAVEEGRTVYDNIRKAVVYILPTSIGEALVIVLAVLAGEPLPITPLQILWINLITTVALDLALAFEPTEEGVMKRPPREPDARMLDGFLVWRVLMVSLLIVGAAYWTFLRADAAYDLETARTATVACIVITQSFYLLNTRYLRGFVLSRRGLVGNPRIYLSLAAVLFLQLVFTYWPPLGLLFDTGPLPLALWPELLALGFGVLVIVEVEKFILYRRSGAPGD